MMNDGKTPRIRLVVNGAEVVSAALNLADLLAEKGYASVAVATARNGDFVPAAERTTTSLQPGDSIEVVSARQGG